MNILSGCTVQYKDSIQQASLSTLASTGKHSAAAMMSILPHINVCAQTHFTSTPLTFVYISTARSELLANLFFSLRMLFAATWNWCAICKTTDLDVKIQVYTCVKYLRAVTVLITFSEIQLLLTLKMIILIFKDTDC